VELKVDLQSLDGWGEGHEPAVDLDRFLIERAGIGELLLADLRLTDPGEGEREVVLP
jgi:hypothetical protein